MAVHFVIRRQLLLLWNDAGRHRRPLRSAGRNDKCQGQYNRQSNSFMHTAHIIIDDLAAMIIHGNALSQAIKGLYPCVPGSAGSFSDAFCSKRAGP